MDDDALPRLVAAHPRVFRGKNPGQALPPGWYELVHQLVTDIEAALGDDVDQLTVSEIKAKFAGLRFYCWLNAPEPPGDPLPASVTHHAGGYTVAAQSRHPQRRAINALIEAASDASMRTCMWCGASSEMLLDGAYVYTACRTHRRPRSITVARYERRRKRKRSKGGEDDA